MTAARSIHPVDSRLRGNDGMGASMTAACSIHPVVSRLRGNDGKYELGMMVDFARVSI